MLRIPSPPRLAKNTPAKANVMNKIGKTITIACTSNGALLKFSAREETLPPDSRYLVAGGNGGKGRAAGAFAAGSEGAIG
jgi:hypothetical protein